MMIFQSFLVKDDFEKFNEYKSDFLDYFFVFIF